MKKYKPVRRYGLWNPPNLIYCTVHCRAVPFGDFFWWNRPWKRPVLLWKNAPLVTFWRTKKVASMLTSDADPHNFYTDKLCLSERIQRRDFGESNTEALWTDCTVQHHKVFPDEKGWRLPQLSGHKRQKVRMLSPRVQREEQEIKRKHFPRTAKQHWEGFRLFGQWILVFK